MEMKFFSSLLIKIVFCFIINLILVVMLLSGFIILQGRVNMHALLGHDESDRLRIAAMLIIKDLNRRPNLEWSEVLTRHKSIYQVDFALVLSTDSIFASEGLKVPAQVITRAAAAILHKSDRPINRDFTSKETFSKHENFKLWRIIGKHHDSHDRLEEHGIKREKGKPTRFMIRTKYPTRYWTGVKVLVPLDDKNDVTPAMLIVGADSITGNGFFFNPFPWVMVVGAIILISAVLWIPLVRHITNPLGRMTRAAEEIANGKFDIDISERRYDEIGRLSSAIKHMTSRLRGVAEGQKRFLRDVAHELGAPIARIQMGLGILEQQLDQKNLTNLKDVAEDISHLSDLVNELLSFSRAEIKPEKIKLAPLELPPIIQRVANREAMTAVEIRVEVSPLIKVIADSSLLSRAIANVVRNAVKYGGQSEPISITARKEKDRVIIEIRDSGPGVSEKLLDKIFEPFFRPEDSRSRESGGVGLGLSIVKTCMDTCGGMVTARNLKPQGFAVSLILPSAD
jgi:two-component system sensor histidine kinase CpxA